MVKQLLTCNYRFQEKDAPLASSLVLNWPEKRIRRETFSCVGVKAIASSFRRKSEMHS